MTPAEAACPAKPGILERSFPWCLGGRGFCMLPNSSMSQRRHVALCVCRLVACYSDTVPPAPCLKLQSGKSAFVGLLAYLCLFVNLLGYDVLCLILCVIYSIYF